MNRSRVPFSAVAVSLVAIDSAIVMFTTESHLRIALSGVMLGVFLCFLFEVILTKYDK